MSLRERYERIQAAMADASALAGRPPGQVTLVAVSKRQPDQAVQALYDLGHRDFGENLVQPWLQRLESVHMPEARWHLIGGLQTRKAAPVAAMPPHLLHTVDRPGLVEALARRLSAERPLDVLLQVNVDKEAQKWGCDPEELDALTDAVSAAPALTLRGLMCIPKPTSQGAPRAAFAATRRLLNAIQDRVVGEPVLSMGMSGDYPEAIAEGSTLVRVGTALFGARDTP